MARVLICEPHEDIAALLELVVRRLGHEPVACAGEAVDHIGVDVGVIEPGTVLGMRTARTLRAKNVPVLFTSIYPAEPDALSLAPEAYLVKPFPLYALEHALLRVLQPVSRDTVVAL